MFRRSRALRGRSEDRCDGADSEAEGAKPPFKPGPMLPVLGVLAFPDTSALVKFRSSGFWIDKARRWPGRFCPAHRRVLHDGVERVTRSRPARFSPGWLDESFSYTGFSRVERQACAPGAQPFSALPPWDAVRIRSPPRSCFRAVRPAIRRVSLRLVHRLRASSPECRCAQSGKSCYRTESCGRR